MISAIILVAWAAGASPAPVAYTPPQGIDVSARRRRRFLRPRVMRAEPPRFRPIPLPRPRPRGPDEVWTLYLTGGGHDLESVAFGTLSGGWAMDDDITRGIDAGAGAVIGREGAPGASAETREAGGAVRYPPSPQNAPAAAAGPGIGYLAPAGIGVLALAGLGGWLIRQGPARRRARWLQQARARTRLSGVGVRMIEPRRGRT